MTGGEKVFPSLFDENDGRTERKPKKEKPRKGVAFPRLPIRRIFPSRRFRLYGIRLIRTLPQRTSE